MKTTRLLAVAVLLGAFGGAAFAAQPFNCGSTGAYGPMNITQDTTLDLPPDGIFHCTTITVNAGATLRFNRNLLNTPVYLLATGDVVVNGGIDVSGQAASARSPGQGGPGGFSGGHGASTMAGRNVGGDGYGPGGGKANLSCGVYGAPILLSGASSVYSNTNVYGNLLLDPLIGGSGGGGGDGVGVTGGGGGGAVLIASNTEITVNGAVLSSGGNGIFGDWGNWNTPGGSGGAIRLVAPIVTGTGDIAARGCMWNIPGIGNTLMPSTGRIRIDCRDNRAYLGLNLVTPASRGSRMIVFRPVTPALDVVNVGGQAIPVGATNVVSVELAQGASTNQTVVVQARNFTNDVPIRVVVAPENGPRGEFDATILQSSGNPPSVSVPVIIPAGSVCQIHAWTR